MLRMAVVAMLLAVHCVFCTPSHARSEASSRMSCGTKCTVDNECQQSPSDPQRCSRCTGAGGITGYCTEGVACGQGCLVDYDCDQYSNCTKCLGMQCSPGCGQPCSSNSQCYKYHCNQCVNSKCARWQCGNPCFGGANDCPGIGPCSHCDMQQMKCVSKCGGECQNDSQCPHQCSHCSEGRCTKNN